MCVGFTVPSRKILESRETELLIPFYEKLLVANSKPTFCVSLTLFIMIQNQIYSQLDAFKPSYSDD